MTSLWALTFGWRRRWVKLRSILKRYWSTFRYTGGCISSRRWPEPSDMKSPNKIILCNRSLGTFYLGLDKGKEKKKEKRDRLRTCSLTFLESHLLGNMFMSRLFFYSLHFFLKITMLLLSILMTMSLMPFKTNFFHSSQEEEPFFQWLHVFIVIPLVDY